MYTLTQTIGAKTLAGAFALLLIVLLTLPFAPFAHAEGEETPPPVVEETPPPVVEETPPPPPEETQSLSENTPEETPPGENGEAGEQGQNGGEEPPLEEGEGADGNPGGPALIETGDAAAVLDSENGANLNDTTVSGVASTTASSTNDAEVMNSAAAGAGTGENTAHGAGGAEIYTGDALASANVINVLNTNLINSFGLFQFLNALFGGGFDLRGLDLSYFFGNPSNGSCSLMSCANGNLNVANGNTASTTNSLLVTADTGANSAYSSGDGDAYISTGDAYASGNLINVINTNIVNSNYLLIAANNFGDMIGDITLPNAEFFMQLLASRMGGVSGNTDINNSNTANVNNSVTAGADSGGNTALTGDGTAVIETGNAVASATTYNQVNTNLVGGSTFYMLINVLGEWSGEVTGLPPGITWARTPTGIALMTDTGASMPSASGCCGGSLDVDNTNTANLTNDVQVYALTGDNYATAESGLAGIETGNAYASANVVNLVNTNIVGQNWMFMIFNIFGNWDGNLSFGKPNLWIGGVAETPNPTNPGAEVTYRFTVANFGDADATDVKLFADFNTGLLDFESGDTPEGAVWNLGNIPRGQSREFSYKAKAGNPPGAQLLPVPLEATVMSTETDENMDDNTERLSIVISSLPPEFAYSRAAVFTTDPKLVITKTASVSTTTIPATVDYTVVVRNDGGPVYNALLDDSMIGPDGEMVYGRAWELDTLDSGEEIRLTYSIVFSKGTKPGLYTNSAKVTGLKNNSKEAFAQGMEPVEVKKVIELTPGGEVLGVTLGKPMCAEYITGHLKPGAKNDPTQVRRLEYFLRDYEGANIEPDSVYDAKTVAAVEDFQEKYAEDVLGPWGLGGATGNVYYTTKQKINEIRCETIARTKFPLSDKQKTEILSFKSKFGSSFALQPKPKAVAEETAPSDTEESASVSEAPPGAPQTPTPQNDELERVRAAKKAGSSNIFQSLFDIFNRGQALLIVPQAEAYMR